MAAFDLSGSLSRRSALALGGQFAGALLASASLGLGAQGQGAPGGTSGAPPPDGPGGHPESVFDRIEDIIQAEGEFSNGVFSIEIDRDDIDNVTLHGVPIKPSFQINGTLYFQRLDRHKVVLNGDMALKAEEIDPFIDQLLVHNIVFQAEHQHFYDFSPLVWFIHFRKVGDPVEIAGGVKAALNVTSTPFPQTMPQNPTTPLPADKLGKILGGDATVGSDGVVTVDVPREDPIILGSVRINPFLNVATPIVFEPYGGGQNAAAAPDFGMIASEIQDVVHVMRSQGWDIGCLYNQETDEHPQLYFSHQFKTGDSVQLAHEIRKGLNRMDLNFK